MNKQDWTNKVKNNFNSAAPNYSRSSFIQKYFSKKIILLMKGLDIPIGNWFDLGAGTGFLADQIEKEFPKGIVTRVDFSENMLLRNKEESNKILWDLNLGLPPSTKGSSLLVSNFCLHWLNEPDKKIKYFYDQLIKGGFLIVTFPNKNCFPEWKETCKKYCIEYSGLELPDACMLQNALNKNEIISIKNYKYKENHLNIYNLFRNIIDIGAQSSKTKRKTVKEIKTLQKNWPKDKDDKVNLTWEINILIIKKS